MTIAKYDAMSLKELRKYVLSHREDVEAFQRYVDRSKAEDNMIILDPSHHQCDEKIEQTVAKIFIKETFEHISGNTSEAVRWCCSGEKADSKFFTISNWWRGLDAKKVAIIHVTQVEVNRETGIWQPIQVSPLIRTKIYNPSIESLESTSIVKYIEKNGLRKQIEATAIDLDLTKEALFVWSTISSKVYVFSVQNQAH